MAIKEADKPIRPTEDQTQPRSKMDEAIQLHVTGQSKFICDESKPEHLCHAVIVPSSYAHARIIRIDPSVAKAIDGVIAILVWQDIPGENQIGIKFKDEPMLPESEVC
jgi:xanthine dehydrogenase large subunit